MNYSTALDASGAAQLLGISFNDLFDLIHDGKIPYYKGFHSEAGFLFFESELITWKDEKLKQQSQWIDKTIHETLYGSKSQIEIFDFITPEVAEAYRDEIMKQALLR